MPDHRSVAIALAFIGLTAAGVWGQSTGTRNDRAGGWVVPRLADGRPDLEGVWENNSATPLERPRQFAGKPRLSDDELALLERRARSLITPAGEAVFGDAFYAALLVGVVDTLGRAFMPTLMRSMFERSTADAAGPALASMLIYLFMAAVLALKPQGLFPAGAGATR